MITSRRDYLLRIIDEVGRLLARVMFKRRGGEDREALQTVVQACERLFGLEADKLFQFTSEQHFAMLSENEAPEIGRDKILLYAALNLQAGQIYAKLGNQAMARASFLNALRLTLRSRVEFGSEKLPEFTPDLDELSNLLAGEPLDPETADRLAQLKV